MKLKSVMSLYEINISKDTNIFVEEAQNINTKIKGINFLEILKFKLLEK